MGDSAACLMRSFSHPSNSIRESQEGDPLRALTESISFGRFASESLAWEKWSAFSHNRYLEEVEQFSKPGSVAAKKAFFEAHYKKRAAMKKAALLEQQAAIVPANVANSDSIPNTVSLVEVQQQQQQQQQQNKLEIDHSPKLEMVVDNVDEMMGEGTPIKESLDLPRNKRRKSSALSAARSETTTSGMSESAAYDKQTATVVSPKLEMDYSPNIERVATESEVGIDEEQMQVDNVGDTIREGTPIKESRDLQTNKRRKNSASSTARSSKTTTTKTSGMSKSASADKQTAIAVSPELEMDYSPNLETVVTESEVDIATPIKESMDLQSNKRRKSSALSAGRTKQTAATSSSRTKVGIEKKVAEDTPVYRKRLAPKAVHISINFASRLWETGKSSLRKSKEHGTGLKSAAVTKGSVQGELKIHASVAAIKASVHGKSEIRSSMAVTKKSVQAEPKIRASVAAATKASVQGKSKIRASMAAGQVHDKSNTKSSGTSRPPLMLSPFSFRSEERAARRKEIMEERNKAKEAESRQMQAKAKEKAKFHSKILRQSTASRTKPDDDSSCRPQPVANQTRKSQVPLTRPRSPKLGRKPAAPYSANMEANKCRSSVRASVNITENSNSSKRVVLKKSIQSTNHSSTSQLPKRKTQENASPNIQL